MPDGRVAQVAMDVESVHLIDFVGTILATFRFETEVLSVGSHLVYIYLEGGTMVTGVTGIGGSEIWYGMASISNRGINVLYQIVDLINEAYENGIEDLTFDGNLIFSLFDGSEFVARCQLSSDLYLNLLEVGNPVLSGSINWYSQGIQTAALFFDRIEKIRDIFSRCDELGIEIEFTGYTEALKSWIAYVSSLILPGIPFVGEDGEDQTFILDFIDWARNSENLPQIFFDLRDGSLGFAILDPAERIRSIPSLEDTIEYLNRFFNEIIVSPLFDDAIASNPELVVIKPGTGAGSLCVMVTLRFAGSQDTIDVYCDLSTGEVYLADLHIFFDGSWVTINTNYLPMNEAVLGSLMDLIDQVRKARLLDGSSVVIDIKPYENVWSGKHFFFLDEVAIIIVRIHSYDHITGETNVRSFQMKVHSDGQIEYYLIGENWRLGYIPISPTMIDGFFELDADDLTRLLARYEARGGLIDYGDGDRLYFHEWCGAHRDGSIDGLSEEEARTLLDRRCIVSQWLLFMAGMNKPDESYWEGLGLGKPNDF